MGAAMAKQGSSPKRGWVEALPLIGIGLAAIAGAIFLGDRLSFEALAANRQTLIDLRDSHYALTALGFVLAYIAIVALSLPGATIATLAGGFLFGVFPGVVFNTTAATIGACLIFLAARKGAGARLAAKMQADEGRIGRLKRGIDENLWSMLFVMRLVPIVPFFAANLLPALVGVRLWPFFVTTYLGILPAGLVYTALGAGLGDVFAAGQTPDLGVIFQPHLLAPLLGLAALAALPALLRVMRKDIP